MFSLTTGIIKKLLSITRNKTKKHNKIAMLVKSKLNSIETLISLALVDLETSHEEFKTIVNEEEKYEGMEGIRMIKSINKSNKEESKTTDMWVKRVRVYKIKNIIYFLMCIKCEHLANKHEKKMV